MLNFRDFTRRKRKLTFAFFKCELTNITLNHVFYLKLYLLQVNEIKITETSVNSSMNLLTNTKYAFYFGFTQKLLLRHQNAISYDTKHDKSTTTTMMTTMTMTTMGQFSQTRGSNV